MIHQIKVILCPNCLTKPSYCWLCNAFICNLCNQEIYCVNYMNCKKEICLNCCIKAF